MPTGARAFPKPKHAACRPPTGVVTAWCLFGIVLALLLGALAWNLAWLWISRLHLQAASEAAALAGAPALMDPTPLYRFPHRCVRAGGRLHAGDELAETPDEAIDRVSSVPSALDVKRFPAARVEHRILLAQEEAIQFAAQNQAPGGPVVLTENPTNAPNEELVAGWVDDPTSLSAGMKPWTGKGRVNSLEVRSHSPRGGVALWFGSLLGLPRAPVAASARATVDQRVYGFRPVGHVHVPLVPLMAVIEKGIHPWAKAYRKQSRGSPTDRVSVDTRFEQVRPGCDGIPELRLRLGALDQNSASETTTEGAALLLSLSAGRGEATIAGDQIRHGLTNENLAGFGGEFALGPDGSLVVIASSLPPASLLTELERSLLAIRGQKRVWPIGIAESSEAGTRVACQVTEFAAASVVDCYQETHGKESWLVVIVQPCLLQTCTALVQPGVELNPWIGKLVLSR